MQSRGAQIKEISLQMYVVYFSVCNLSGATKQQDYIRSTFWALVTGLPLEKTPRG